MPTECFSEYNEKRGTACGWKLKRFLWYVVGVLTLSALSAVGSEPRHEPFFGESFEESVENAKEEDKSLFVYFYKQDSVACQIMDNQFLQRSVGRFLTTRFINVKIDVENDESNGPDLAKRFSISTYPTYLILDHNGKETHRATRAMQGDVFIDTISWLTGETEFPMAEQDAKYEAGERDPVFVQQYLLDARSVLSKNISAGALHWNTLGETQEKYTAIAREYLASQKPENLINSRDFLIIKAYSTTLDDPGIKLVLDHLDAFVKTTSKEQISDTVYDVAITTAQLKALEGDETYLDVIESLEEGPLRNAVDWQPSVDPDARRWLEHLREQLKDTFDNVTQSSSRSLEQEN